MNDSSDSGGRKTLYINNLNERIPHKILNAELRKLCSQFAKPNNVYTARGIRKRGQAFVAFNSHEDAMLVLEKLHDSYFFKKKMRIVYAKNDSDCAVDESELISRKEKRRESKGRVPQTTTDKTETTENINKSAKEEDSASKTTTESKQSSEKVVANYGDPHNILLLQQIPDSVKLQDLQTKCSQFNGYLEARMFAVKHVGFIDFDSVENAVAAIDHIAGMGLGNVTYAKK